MGQSEEDGAEALSALAKNRRQVMDTGHDVNALVDLATAHKDKWGDSCHHALAGEVVRLREILQRNAKLDVDRIRDEGRSCEVLRTIVREAKDVD
jgi:hypothetical protein